MIQIKPQNSIQICRRLWIWGYSMDEYLYILAKDGLTLQHKTYSEDDDFE